VGAASFYKATLYGWEEDFDAISFDIETKRSAANDQALLLKPLTRPDRSVAVRWCRSPFILYPSRVGEFSLTLFTSMLLVSHLTLVFSR
jgi:hypothetical protein